MLEISMALAKQCIVTYTRGDPGLRPGFFVWKLLVTYQFDETVYVKL